MTLPILIGEYFSMPYFSLTVAFRGSIGQKSYREEVTEELERKGADIRSIHSIISRIGESITPVNRVTITYKALREIKTRQN